MRNCVFTTSGRNSHQTQTKCYSVKTQTAKKKVVVLSIRSEFFGGAKKIDAQKRGDEENESNE